MDDKQAGTVTGTVEEVLPNSLFRVRIAEGSELTLAYLAGKMRKHHIRVVPGDRVAVEMTPYDEKRGRLVRRL